MRKTTIEKQEKILEFIHNFISDNGYPPSVREICSALEIRSTSTVHAHIENLQRQGLLHKSPSKTRALNINTAESTSDFSDEISEVPVVGSVSAGLPALAIENIEYSIPLPSYFTKNSDCFILKVKGDSMMDAGILDGDYVVVRKQSDANGGEIVVALLDDEATVKTIQKKSTGIWLVPHNPTMSPFKVENPVILGKVISVLRRY